MPAPSPDSAPAPGGPTGVLTGRDLRLFAACGLAVLLAGVLRYVHAGTFLPFLAAGVALAMTATLVGHAVDALGDRLGAGATGVVQSSLGNLPELFVCLFALRAGLIGVVQGALVGSILANVLLVLGAAFIAGGLRHGPQSFPTGRARTLALLLLLAVSALLIPALTSALHTPAAGHELALSRVVAGVLLLLFALSLPAALAKAKAPDTSVDPGASAAERELEAELSEVEGEEAAAAAAEHVAEWPVALAITVLAVAALAAAAVSDWFIHALEPAIHSFGISEAFAGLVIVAIAGNAVENVVGIRLAARNRADYAVSIILQSPLQIALVLAPALVLLAPVVGASFTLVLPPLLVAALFLAVIVTVVVVFDGESTWLEGAALVGLYVVIASAFWWG